MYPSTTKLIEGGTKNLGAALVSVPFTLAFNSSERQNSFPRDRHHAPPSLSSCPPPLRGAVLALFSFFPYVFSKAVERAHFHAASSRLLGIFAPPLFSYLLLLVIQYKTRPRRLERPQITRATRGLLKASNQDFATSQSSIVYLTRKCIVFPPPRTFNHHKPGPLARKNRRLFGQVQHPNGQAPTTGPAGLR